MDKDYIKIVIEVAKEKLKLSNKPLSENEFTRSLVALLKKKHGKSDNRHSSKTRFRREVFKYLIETDDWKEEIIQTNDKRFALKCMDLPASKTDLDWYWNNVDINTVRVKILNILKKIDPFKFEVLVGRMIEEIFDYKAQVTSKTGDMGTDIIAFKDDVTQKEKKQAMFVQVKRFKKTVGREVADSFIGAVQEYYEKEKWSRFDGLIVTTGTFPDSFREKLKRSEKSGINFSCWDGKELTDRLIKLGWGINYSIDINFWNKFDSSLVPKEK